MVSPSMARRSLAAFWATTDGCSSAQFDNSAASRWAKRRLTVKRCALQSSLSLWPSPEHGRI